MLKIYSVLGIALLSVLPLVAFAAEAPETVILKAKNGNITLDHKGHGNMMSCSICHGETIGKMLPLGKDKGHALCLECHKTGGAGPVKCADCHKK